MEYSPQRNVQLGYEYNRSNSKPYLETERQLMFAALLGKFNHNEEQYRSFHSAAELARDKHVLLECGGSCSHAHYTHAKNMNEMRE